MYSYIYVVRGKLSGIASERSEFYMKDEEDDRVRCIFTIYHYSDESRFVQVNAMIDSDAQSELTLPASLIETLGLIPTGRTVKCKGSNNLMATKRMYKPVRLVAKFMRGSVEEERFDYMSVGVFENEIEREQTASEESGKRRRVSGGSDSSREGIITSVPLYEHRPPGNTSQRVILGAAALKRLSFHLNISEKCLEIEEEHIIED